MDSMMETLEPEIVLVYSKMPDEIEAKYPNTKFVEYPDFITRSEQGSAMSSNGKYVYGVYDINGNETVSIAHSWKELYDEGWVSKKSEPF